MYGMELNLTLIHGTETKKWPTLLKLAKNEEYAITHERMIISLLSFHNHYTHMLVYTEKKNNNIIVHNLLDNITVLNCRRTINKTCTPNKNA